MTLLERKDVPVEATWKREDVFPTWADWDKQYEEIIAVIPDLAAYNGKITESPQALADWFELLDGWAVKAGELQGFVSWASNVDSSDSEAKSRMGMLGGMLSQFGSAISFQDPQLLEVGEPLLEWADQEQRLAPYRHYFDNLLRLQANTRSQEVEEVLSALGDSIAAPFRVYSELTNSDLKFEDALDNAGDSHPIYQSTINSSYQTTDQKRRKTAWENYYDSYLGMQNTLASLYQMQVKQQEFLRKTRGFDSVLEMRLSPNNLPTDVFHNLINVFVDNLPVWHRYWAVKAKLLGVGQISPYDIWAPIQDDPPKIPYDQAVEWICTALEPMGQEYVDIMRKGSIEDRWVDWAPNVEKRQGAASSRMIGRKAPYIFMSYNETVYSLSTLAHELGHSMHSYMFATHQPTVYNAYGAISSTLTETASNFHQVMTRAYLRNIKGDDDKFMLAMVDEAMSNFHRYFFVMPTLARFELQVYEWAKQGKPMTAGIFNDLMSSLFAEGYGDTMADDPARTGITWAQFLHLYIPFYPFQYAIGISAAHDAGDRILAGDAGAKDGYLSFLQAGGSRYAMDLFNMMGVDMTSRGAIESAFKEMESNVAKLEELAG